MSNQKTVAIVGRPNVGKSALFNRIAKRRISIVDAKPGITRDRIYANVNWGNKNFRLIDTGGIIVNSCDQIDKQIKIQADIAISEADKILFLCDVKDGLTALDKELFNMLREANKSMFVCVNKVDHPGKEAELGEFYAVGCEDVYSLSAIHGVGINTILDEITKDFPDGEFVNEEVIKIAVVGKPNVGKSSLINTLLSEDRNIVSDIPGTTRDAVDTLFIYNEKKYLLIDTAGIRANKKVNEAVDYFSVLRSEKSIERCNIAALVIDGPQGVTSQDLRIAHTIYEKGKGVIIVINKWDLVKGVTMKAYEREVFHKLRFMLYAPVLFVSALSGRNVDKIPDITQRNYEQGSHSISTSMLNKFLEDVQMRHQPPLIAKKKRLKMFYITQVGILPPTFIIFLNNKQLMKSSYESYMINGLRKVFDFEGNPIIFKYKSRRNEG